MSSLVFSSFLLALLWPSALAALYQSASQLSKLEYDYVIVGGGAAGCVLASRLTENPDVTVLLIEAGPTNEGVENIAIPYQNPSLQYPGSPYIWNFTTVPQRGLYNRTVPYLRGYVLGGSTSINGMTYTRGYPAEYDKFAASVGDKGFTWKNLQPYIRRNEAFQLSTTVNITGRFNPAVHNYNGSVGVSVHMVPEWIYQPILDAASETGGNYQYNEDYNTGSMLGIGWQQSTIRGGVRDSAATAYINSQSSVRPNLDVVVNTMVSRVLAKDGTSPPQFTSAEFSGGSNGTLQAVARKEVIVSCGTLSTPPLLMRSGLGPEDQLKAAGIKPVLVMPQVGQNLIDHIEIALPWLVNTTQTDDTITRNATLMQELLDQWNKDHSGRLSTVSNSHIKFSRIPDNSTIYRTVRDPTAGPEGPHYEQLINNNWVFYGTMPTTGNFVSIIHFMNSPISHGSVRLNITDPMGSPLIDPGYLNEEFDVFVLRTAVRESIGYMRAPAWQKFNATPAFDMSVVQNDTALDAYIRNNVGGGVHCIGTSRMVSANSNDGVVGPDFKVKGVKGLRIVDSSVIPFIPSAHIMATTYILAERAADVIKAS